MEEGTREVDTLARQVLYRRYKSTSIMLVSGLSSNVAIVTKFSWI